MIVDLESNMEGPERSMEEVQSKEPEKKEAGKDRWYHRKWVRFTAGAVAVILTLFTIAYDLLRSQYNSLYEDFAESEDALKEMSRASSDKPSLQDPGLGVEYIELLNLLDSENYSKSIETANKLIESEKDIALKMALEELLCQLYYSEGRYQEAIDTATYIIDTDSSPNYVPYYVRGMGELQLGRYDVASKDLKRALDTGFVDEDNICLQLAICSYSGKQYGDSILYAEKYLDAPKEIASDDEEKEKKKSQYVSNDNLCRYIAAISYMNQEDFESSRKHFDDLLSTEEDRELYYYRGIDNMALEDYEAAVKDFSKAKEMGKKDTELYYDLGICLISSGSVQEGTEALLTVIERNDRPELTTASTNILSAIIQER